MKCPACAHEFKPEPGPAVLERLRRKRERIREKIALPVNAGRCVCLTTHPTLDPCPGDPCPGAKCHGRGRVHKGEEGCFACVGR